MRVRSPARRRGEIDTETGVAARPLRAQLGQPLRHPGMEPPPPPSRRRQRREPPGAMRRGSQAPPADRRLTVEVLHDIGAIYDAWERLWARDPCATPFTHPAWHRSYLNSHRRTRAIFLVLRDARGELAGVCPLMRRGRRLCFLSTPRPDFVRPTLAPDLDLKLALDLLLAAARTAAPGATIELSPLHPDDEDLAALIVERAQAAGIPAQAYSAGPSLRLSTRLDPEAMRSKFEGSRHIRRHLAKLRQEGGYAYERIADRAGMLAELPRLFVFHTRRWSAGGNQIFLDPQVRQFYRELVRTFPGDHLSLARLSVGGQVEAVSLDFQVRGVFYNYKRVFDVDQRAHRAGLAMLCEIGRDIARRDVWALEFGRGDEPYKRRFANQSGEIRRVVLYPGRLARALDRRLVALGSWIRAWLPGRRMIKARAGVLRTALARCGAGGARSAAFVQEARKAGRPRQPGDAPAGVWKPGCATEGVSFRSGGVEDLFEVLDLHDRIDRPKHFAQLFDQLRNGDQLVVGHVAGELVFAGWLARDAQPPSQASARPEGEPGAA